MFVDVVGGGEWLVSLNGQLFVSVTLVTMHVMLLFGSSSITLLQLAHKFAAKVWFITQLQLHSDVSLDGLRISQFASSRLTCGVSVGVALPPLPSTTMQSFLSTPEWWWWPLNVYKFFRFREITSSSAITHSYDGGGSLCAVIVGRISFSVYSPDVSKYYKENKRRN